MIKVIFIDLGGVFAKADFEKNKKKLNQILEPTKLSWEDFSSTWGKFYILRSSGKIKNIEESDLFLQRITQKNIPIRKLTKFITEEIFTVPSKNIDIVKKLKKSYKVALLSNSIKEWVDEILNRYRIKNLFDALIISSEVGVRKPQIKIYQEALDKFAVKPKETAFVSDELGDDLCMASVLGIKTIWLNDKKEKCGEIDRKIVKNYQPDLVIKNFNEISRIIKKLK